MGAELLKVLTGPDNRFPYSPVHSQKVTQCPNLLSKTYQKKKCLFLPAWQCLPKRGYPGGMYITRDGAQMWVMVLLTGTGHQVVAE